MIASGLVSWLRLVVSVRRDRTQFFETTNEEEASSRLLPLTLHLSCFSFPVVSFSLFLSFPSPSFVRCLGQSEKKRAVRVESNRVEWRKGRKEKKTNKNKKETKNSTIEVYTHTVEIGLFSSSPCLASALASVSCDIRRGCITMESCRIKQTQANNNPHPISSQWRIGTYYRRLTPSTLIPLHTSESGKPSGSTDTSSSHSSSSRVTPNAIR